jgi:hypothetical protein
MVGGHQGPRTPGDLPRGGGGTGSPDVTNRATAGRGRFSIRWGVGDLSGGGGSNGVGPQGLMRVAPGRVGSMRAAPGQVGRHTREWDPVASGRCGGFA